MDDKEFLTYFDKVQKATDQEEVFTNTENIIKTLETVVQNKKSDFSSSFGKQITEDVDYALNKLIGGLTCTTPLIQLNYSLVIQKLLEKFPVDAQSFISTIIEKTHKKNTVNKTERSFYTLGREYAFYALINSQLVDKMDNCEGLYQNIFSSQFEDLEQYSWISNNIIKSIEKSLENGKNIKTKLKVLSQLVKPYLKSHNYLTIKLLTVLYFAYKKNTITFPLDNYLKDKIFNPKILKQVLLDENLIKEFPNKNQKVCKMIVFYMRSESQSQKSDMWLNFWKFLLKDIQKPDSIKHCYLILCFFKAFFKIEDLNILDLKNIMNEDLIHIWLKNLNNTNKNFKVLCQKIEKQFCYQLNKFVKISKEKENRKLIVDVLIMLKNRTTFRFAAKDALPRNLFKILEKDEYNKYLTSIKNHLKNAKTLSDKLYYLNELHVFTEFKFQDMEDQEVVDICITIFEESNEKNILNYYDKQNVDGKKMDKKQFISQNQEQILGYYYSILSTLCKAQTKVDETFKLKGFTKDNSTYAFKILTTLMKKKENFSNNEKLVSAFEEVSQKIAFLEKIQNIIQKKLEKKNFDDSGYSLKKRIAIFNVLTATCIQGLFDQEQFEENFSELQQVHKDIKENYENESNGEEIKKKKKLNNGETKDDEDKQDFIQVLNDILISNLTKSNAYLRDITNQCFQIFISQIDQQCLSNLTAVIARKNEEYIQDMLQQEAMEDSELGDDMEQEEDSESDKDDDDEEDDIEAEDDNEEEDSEN